MDFKDNDEKVVYYSQYLPLVKQYAKDEDFTSSDGKSYDESASLWATYETSMQYKTKLGGEMIEIFRSSEINEEDFSEDLKALMQKARERMPDDILEEFPNG